MTDNAIVRLRPERDTLIGVGDLARALGVLKPDAESLRDIAYALGYELPAPAEPPRPDVIAPAPKIETPITTRLTRSPRIDRAAETPPLTQPSIELGGDTVSFEVAHTVLPLATPAPLTTDRLLDDAPDTPPPLQPLFRPNWSRAILSTALATDGEHGPLNLEAVVDSFARRAHVHVLPRLPWPTLRRGVQVLIDRSQALSPYWRDQDHVCHLLVDVVGRDKVQVLTFTGFPLPTGDSADARPWGTFPLTIADEVEPETLTGDYRPPLAGTVVLLLTDLGLGRAVAASERADLPRWLEFAQLVRKANCPLVALTPYAPRRWPLELRRALKIIQWDRQTTAASVRHVIGRVHQVART